MNRYLSIILAGTALLGAASAANATAIFQAQTYGAATTVFTSPALYFNGFDTSLGTLISVEADISNTQSTYSGSVTNLGEQAVTDTLSIATRITLAASSNTPAALTGLNLLTPGEQFSFTGLASGATQTFGPTTETISNLTFYIDPANLGQFQNGAFSLAAFGTSPSSFAAGGSVAAINTVVAQGTISLEYDYTPNAVVVTNPIPEPASMALLGAGLLGAGLIRRRGNSAC